MLKWLGLRESSPKQLVWEREWEPPDYSQVMRLMLSAMKDEIRECLCEGAKDALEMMLDGTELLVVWVIPERSWADDAFVEMQQYVLGHPGLFDRVALSRPVGDSVSLMVDNHLFGMPLRFVLLEEIPTFLFGKHNYYIVDDLGACRQTVKPIEWERAWDRKGEGK